MSTWGVMGPRRPGCNSANASQSQPGWHLSANSALTCSFQESELSPETLPSQLTTSAGSEGQEPGSADRSSQSANTDVTSTGMGGRVGGVPLKPPSLASSTAFGTAARKGQGYRKLWQVVSKVQRGQTLDDSEAAREDVTVEDLVKTVQQLPASASAVEAISPGIEYLDSRATAALLKGLAKAGMGQRAVEIFDFLRGLESDHELYPLCDIFTYTTMISQCNSHHQLRRALELVAEMRSRAVPLNVHTYSALLYVCLKANELDLSLDVYTQMLQEGCTPNLVTYNTLLDIYNKMGHWMDALNVLELLQHQNIKPEARTYNAIIQCCNTSGRYNEAVRVHKLMCSAGIEPNGATFIAALTSYARSGQLEAALSLFNMMTSRGYERGANTYAAVLSACELPGRWDLALELLQQMQLEGVHPSTACLTSTISACMHGGQPQYAEQLFERMCAFCKPDATTFNCLVCVYCRLGKHREAINMLEVMLRGGQHVDITTYDAAINACWATGAVPLQKYALQLYDRARQQGLFKALMGEQVGPTGSALDIQLPSGSPHVVLISLLHMLRDLREQYANMLVPQTVIKVVLTLGVQGREAAPLGNTVMTQLHALSSPFTALPLPALARTGAVAVDELQFAADSLLVSEWLRGSQLAVALDILNLGAGTLTNQPVLAGRGVDGMVAAQEDAQRELKCRQALLSVHAFENGCHIDAQNMPQALLLQRGELVQLLLSSPPCLGIPSEVAHDSAQLLDRMLASGLAANVSGRLLAAACLHAMSQQDININSTTVLAQLFQVPAQQLLVAVQQVRQLMGGNCVAISALRVLRLLLERLGVESEDAASTRHVCGQAFTVIGRAAMHPAFIGCPPSVVAMAVLYTCRAAAGLMPSWPAALLTLTGYSESNDLLQPYIRAAMQLLLEP